MNKVIKTLILLADGFEEIEAMSTVDILRRCGFVCDMCSVQNKDFVTGGHNIIVKSELYMVNLTDISDYDAIILPGGSNGTDIIKQSPDALHLIKSFFDDGKLCAAICAAPSVFTLLRIADGKRITSYPGCVLPSDKYEYCEESAVTDENIITSRGAGTSCQFAYAIAVYFNKKEKADKVIACMIY